MVSEMTHPGNTKHGASMMDSAAMSRGADWMESYRKVLEALLAAREAAGLRQTDVAKRLHRGQSTVSAWDRGENEMGIDELSAYANAVGLDLRVALYPKNSATPDARFMGAIEGLSPIEIDALLTTLAMLHDAPADARWMAIRLLRSAATTP